MYIGSLIEAWSHICGSMLCVNIPARVPAKEWGKLQTGNVSFLKALRFSKRAGLESGLSLQHCLISSKALCREKKTGAVERTRALKRCRYPVIAGLGLTAKHGSSGQGRKALGKIALPYSGRNVR